MNKFIEGLENEENKKYTGNGANEAFKYTNPYELMLKTFNNPIFDSVII